MCPNVPSLGMHAEHGAKALAERWHRGSVAMDEIFIVLQPAREAVKRYYLPHTGWY